MLCLKGKNLVVSSLRVRLSLHDDLVHFLAVVLDVVDFLLIAAIDMILHAHLLSLYVDLLAKGKVASLQVTVLDKGFVELVLHGFDVVEVQSHFG
jgi:hypothetical protein